MSVKNNKVKWDKVQECFDNPQFPNSAISIPFGWPLLCNPLTTAFGDIDVDPQWHMPKKIAVHTAITGAFINKALNPNQPIEAAEAKAEIRKLCEAGAEMIHIHTRDEVGLPNIDYDRLLDYMDSVKADFPNVMFNACIVPSNPEEYQLTKRIIEDRTFNDNVVNCVASYNGDFLFVKPPHMMIDKARLILENGQVPQIAVTGPGDIDNADRYLIKSGLIDGRTYWGVLIGLPGGIPAHSPKAMIEGLMIMINRIREIDPGAVINVASSGRASRFLNTFALLQGCDIRVGMEDTIWKYPHSNEKLTSNVEAFLWAKNMVESLGYEMATAQEYLQNIRGEITL